MPYYLALILLTFCLVVCTSALCPTGQFGTDCTCTTDIPSVVSLTTGATVTCSSGLWTITSTATVAGTTISIDSDRIWVQGNLTIAANTTLQLLLNAANTSIGPYITVGGVFWQTPLLEVDIDARNLGTTSPLTVTIPFASYAQTGQMVWPIQTARIAPFAGSFCWTLSSAVLNIGAQNASMTYSLVRDPSKSCNTGYFDRSWVIAAIVLLFLFGAALLAIALISFRHCRERFWTNE
jgi:hypothetical protein